MLLNQPNFWSRVEPKWSQIRTGVRQVRMNYWLPMTNSCHKRVALSDMRFLVLIQMSRIFQRKKKTTKKKLTASFYNFKVPLTKKYFSWLKWIFAPVPNVLWPFFLLVTNPAFLKRFSTDCRKTKAITPTNHNRSRQPDEPITIPCNYL